MTLHPIYGIQLFSPSHKQLTSRLIIKRAMQHIPVLVKDLIFLNLITCNIQ